jgi:hypothetical protein
MQHFRLACETGRPMTSDEATALRLPPLNTMPELEPWRTTLHQAADIIENLGWCRGALRHGTRYCAVGAIIAAYNKGEIPRRGCLESFLLANPDVQWTIVKVESYLKERELAGWNDWSATGGKEVISVFRAAATFAEPARS